MRIELRNMEDDYDALKNTIVSLYTEPFELFIDTKHISNVSLYMVTDFAFFLHQLKKKDPQYLKYTTIYKLFTYLSRPIAPVKVIYMEEDKIKYIKTFFP